jgi:hypothetical protein
MTATLGIDDRVNETPGITVELKITELPCLLYHTYFINSHLALVTAYSRLILYMSF